MSQAHLFYIPFIGLVGLVFGYLWGAKSIRRQIEEAERRGHR